ncbi:MAG: 4-hydroxy-3-methylbut-2-enyl diphosphate reductase [bacterium]|nr:4-hydroxy-3-methylbut-2-enyl diphosphate reductase [bacterium]
MTHLLRTVTLARTAGFCWGVERAIDGARGAKDIRGKDGQNFFVLGNLVHNAVAVEDLEQKGIRVTEHMEEAKGSTLFITAHGRNPKDIEQARDLLGDKQVIDMTCPIVKNLHAMALELKNEGRKMVLIGIRSRHHPEVAGVIGVLEGEVHVVQFPDEVTSLPYEAREPIGVVNQTTFNAKEIDRILEALHARFVNVRYIPTMCDDISKKQAELRERGRAFDAVIVIGDPRSANSTHLAEISSNELQRHTLFILRDEELLKEDLDGAEHIFVTAGASTPSSSIESVLRKLEVFGFARNDSWDVRS